MTAPVIRQYAGTIPDKGQAQTSFDTNVDGWLDWTTLQFAPDLVAFGTWADGVRASLIAGNLPSLTGRNLDAVRVNAAGNDVEFADVTAAGWALLDDANATAQRVTLGLGSAALMVDSANADLTVAPDGVLRRDIAAAAFAAAVQYMMVRDEKANSAAAQYLNASTWTKRDINAVVANSITGASLSSSAITLPAGTYRISASVPGYRANAFKARVRHNTSAITYGVSTSENSHSSYNTSTQALIKNEFTLGSTTAVKIEMIVQTPSNGGSPAGVIGNNTENEIYTVVELWKIA